MISHLKEVRFCCGAYLCGYCVLLNLLESSSSGCFRNYVALLKSLEAVACAGQMGVIITSLQTSCDLCLFDPCYFISGGCWSVEIPILF